MNINVKVNPAYLDFLNKHHFTQIYFGGSSSGKSFFICQKIVLDNIAGANYLICRNVANTIRKSTYNEIKKAIYRMGFERYYRFNGTDMIITNVLNGRQILFAGLDDPEKIKSISPADDVLHRVFIEEATETRRDSYMQLKKRLRGKSDISKHIIMAFNPILKSHWIYQEFFKEWEDDKNYYESDNYGATDTKKGYSLCILKTTYKDNIFLTADDIALLENESDPYYYNVYSLGNWGILGHVIFKNWHVEDLSDRIPQFDRVYNGCDWGWEDPTAMVKVHLDKNRKKIYVFGEEYQQYLDDDMVLKVAGEFTNWKEYITCDSAEPRLINHLANNGVRAVAANKNGAGSILSGIRWLQGYEIIVDVRCQNFKNEIEQYHWKEDKFGNVLEIPVDANNHLLDALRYALNDEILAAEVKAGRRI